jgi:hypothetical protein
VRLPRNGRIWPADVVATDAAEAAQPISKALTAEALFSAAYASSATTDSEHMQAQHGLMPADSVPHVASALSKPPNVQVF